MEDIVLYSETRATSKIATFNDCKVLLTYCNGENFGERVVSVTWFARSRVMFLDTVVSIHTGA